MPESSEIASEREELQTKMNCRLGVMACMHARRVCHESASARERQLRRSLAAAEAEIAAVSVSDLTAECQADWVRSSVEKDLGFVSNTGNQGGTAMRGGGRDTSRYTQLLPVRQSCRGTLGCHALAVPVYVPVRWHSSQGHWGLVCGPRLLHGIRLHVPLAGRMMCRATAKEPLWRG